MNLDFAHYSYSDGKRRFLVTWIINPEKKVLSDTLPQYLIQIHRENDFETKTMTGHIWGEFTKPQPTDLSPTVENALLILKPHL